MTCNHQRPTRRAFFTLAVTLLMSALALPCQGVVIDAGDGTGNTTAPADDPGFKNVAIRGSATAIYLGNRWAMTASHVGAGPVVLDGVEYNHLPQETVRLTNPSGLSESTDVVLFRLQNDPDLPSLRLPCNEVNLGSTVTLIGGGHDREPDSSAWVVSVRPGENNDVWTPTEIEASSDRQGYRTLDTQTVRWGTSLVTLTDFDTDSGFGDVLTFQTSFDPISKLDDLSQGVRGDSGGAAFQKNAGFWELTGLIHAVSLLENQPGATRTAIYGNETFLADLFQYSDQIRSIADFEPIAGDLDANGTVDAADIDALLDVIRQPQIASCHYDIDGSESLDGSDLTAIVTAAGGLLGDANLDGVVGFADFLVLSQSFGMQGTSWSDGDFDGDDRVTLADFLILSNDFGNALPRPAASAEPVPEPRFSLAALLLAAIVAARRLSRKAPAEL